MNLFEKPKYKSIPIPEKIKKELDEVLWKNEITLRNYIEKENTLLYSSTSHMLHISWNTNFLEKGVFIKYEQYDNHPGWMQPELMHDIQKVLIKWHKELIANERGDNE